MQRKNSLLRTSQRSGMAMIMAIVVVVVVATILALSLSLTTTTTKKTTDLYLYEQATILSHSAAEYAVLRASLQNPCTFRGTNFRYNSTYDINITMRYIGVKNTPCWMNSRSNDTNYSTTTFPDSNGTVIMDIAVIANPTGTTEPIRYFRRTLQKL